MKKNTFRLMTLIFAAAFLACTSSQPANEDQGEPIDHNQETLVDDDQVVEAAQPMVSDYFPPSRMTKVFSGGFENEGMNHVVLSVENGQVQILQEDTGTNLIMVYEITNDQITIIFAEAEYYSTERIEDVTPNRNSIILKAPLEVGNKWGHEFAGYLEITAVDLDVKMPAGTFSTVEVTYAYEDYTTKYYYARELGLVKTVSDFATNELVAIR